MEIRPGEMVWSPDPEDSSMIILLTRGDKLPTDLDDYLELKSYYLARLVCAYPESVPEVERDLRERGVLYSYDWTVIDPNPSLDVAIKQGFEAVRHWARQILNIPYPPEGTYLEPWRKQVKEALQVPHGITRNNQKQIRWIVEDRHLLMEIESIFLGLSSIYWD